MIETMNEGMRWLLSSRVRLSALAAYSSSGRRLLPLFSHFHLPSYPFTFSSQIQLLTMKSQIVLLLLGALAMGVNGLVPQQQYLITYPKDAPQSDLDDYKHAITAAGGQILHEYELIKSEHMP